MKLNRKITRLAACVLASALLVCGAALPAMADTTTGIQDGDTFVVNSYLQVPEHIASPQVSFVYTLATATASSSEVWGTGANETEVYSGETGGLTFVDADASSNGLKKTVTYDTAAAQNPEQGKTYYTLSDTVSIQADVTKFAHAGVYKYTLNAAKSSTNTNGSFTVDNAERTIYVYVNNGSDNSRVIDAITMVNGTTKTDSFTHQYLFTSNTPDPTGKAASLVLDKTVAGDLGNKDQGFSFTVTVEASDDAAGTRYAYQRGTMNNGTFNATEPDSYELLKTGANSFTLKHNEAIQILGLAKGDKYTISETKNDKYTTTASVTNDSGAATNDNDNGKYTVSNTNGLADAAIAATGDTIRVAYTNTHKEVTPTGVILNVAPYVLMVVIAVAAAFVFLRKRRED